MNQSLKKKKKKEQLINKQHEPYRFKDLMKRKTKKEDKREFEFRQHVKLWIRNSNKYPHPFVLLRHQCWHFVTLEFIAANGCTVVDVGRLLSAQLSMR